MITTNEWTGPVGDVWAQLWQQTDRSFSELTAQLSQAILAVAPYSGRAVDIGCGAGETAIGLACARPGLEVAGIDISDGLVDVARTRARNLNNIAFVLGDAATEASRLAPIDLFISRHGVMFFDDPIAVFTALHAAASTQGCMVFSCFRDWSLNAFAYEIAELADGVAPSLDAPGPFAFASKEKVEQILAASGWREIESVAVDFAYCAGEGEDPVTEAVSFMRRIGPAARAIRAADQDRRPAIIGGLRRICKGHRQGRRVLFPAAAWIWTARA